MGRLKAERDDRTLVERVLERGDERAFRELYRRHTPYLYQFALRVLGGHEQEAEDVIQETWIRAVGGLAGFRWQAGLRTWLGGIVLNQCRSLFRRRERFWVEAVPAAEPVSLPPPVERVDLERALAKLPDGYRTVLVLHDIEGYRHEDIARALGTTAGTSKSQLHRARRAIRTMLDSDAGAGTGTEVRDA
ncbi:MAG: RNA polymerase sigma factor [Gemmatimonadota bacterium]|jgi:RNA polymerase sigma-70 factor (ECF subfamily)